MKSLLEKYPVEMSAPCRLDFGGTLDISTFYLPLRHLHPSTFNIAINMRTHVCLMPWASGRVKITSSGFDEADFNSDNLPFSHPMGLMFAIAAYFGADGVHIDIKSSSPPRSALGGSSVAAVALISAFLKVTGGMPDGRIPRDKVVLLAHGIESSVARVPCGMQDQLAAAYGGVNSWNWTGNTDGLPYAKQKIIGQEAFLELEQSIVAAYCGEPHESKDINGKWVDHFLKGSDRAIWTKIISCCNRFKDVIAAGDYTKAAELMIQETELRREMTPDVLDLMGLDLVKKAKESQCGARFTGAGGGGCVWAIGEKDRIANLKIDWNSILRKNKKACLLDVKIDSDGVRNETTV